MQNKDLSKVVSKILKTKAKVTKSGVIDHPGDGKLVWLIANKRKYILKHYSTPRHTQLEIKNWENIEQISDFNKPKYFGHAGGYLLISFIEGTLFQDMIDKNGGSKLDSIYYKAVDQLVKVHASLEKIKDQRKLRKRFTEAHLKKTLPKGIREIKAGILKSPFAQKQKDTWLKSIRKIKQRDLLSAIAVSENFKILSHGDFKPNNLIVNAKNEIVVIDWIGLSAGTPWYDLAYLLVHAPKNKKAIFMRYYLRELQKANFLGKLHHEEACKLFLQGQIYQELVRAHSNYDKLANNKNQEHHRREFSKALNALTALTSA
jgi:thiamine kinase-like enzyme